MAVTILSFFSKIDIYMRNRYTPFWGERRPTQISTLRVTKNGQNIDFSPKLKIETYTKI